MDLLVVGEDRKDDRLLHEGSEMKRRGKEWNEVNWKVLEGDDRLRLWISDDRRNDIHMQVNNNRYLIIVVIPTEGIN